MAEIPCTGSLPVLRAATLMPREHGIGHSHVYVSCLRTCSRSPIGVSPNSGTSAGRNNRNGALTEVKGLVEKPRPGTSPSNLAVIGRYILQPEVMRVLETQEKGAGNEIQLTDAMARMIGDQPFHGLTFDGKRYDCGDKAGYVQANIAVALGREDIGPAVRAFTVDLLR